MTRRGTILVFRRYKRGCLTLCAAANLSLTIAACSPRGVADTSFKGDKCSTPWSATRLWPSLPYSLTAMSVAGVGSNLLVAGNVQNPGDPELLGPLVLLDSAGRSVEVPSQARQGIRPRLALAGDTIYLLWGEAKPDTVRMGSGAHYPRRTRAVWFASRVAGEWSVPREIVRVQSGEVGWEPEHAGAPIRDRLGAWHLAFVASESPADARLLELTLTNGRADVSSVRLPTIGVYVQLAVVGDKTVVLYVHGDMSRAPDQNSVSIITRGGADTSWTPPLTIQAGGKQGALSPRLVVTADGVIHAIWAQSRTDGLRPEMLRHVASRDEGVAWSAPTDMPSLGALPIVAIPASRSDVAVLFYKITPGETRTVIACWRAGTGWQPPRSLTTGPVLWPASTGNGERVLAVRARPGKPHTYENVLVQAP